MKIKELKEEVKGFSDAELKDRIDAEVTQYVKLKLEHSVSPIENPLRLKYQRRHIARLKGEERKRMNNNASTKK